MTRLIGLNGLKGSGKDTVFGLMCECHPELDIQREAFADRLKVYAARLLGFEMRDTAAHVQRMDECKNGWMLMVKNADGYLLKCQTGRELLQRVGDQARQVFGEEFWIDQVLPKEVPDEDYWSPDIIVITDVRYENEADRVHDLGGEIWHVARPGLESDGHISEVPLPAGKIDVVIDNCGTKQDLKDAIDLLV